MKRWVLFCIIIRGLFIILLPTTDGSLPPQFSGFSYFWENIRNLSSTCLISFRLFVFSIMLPNRVYIWFLLGPIIYSDLLNPHLFWISVISRSYFNLSSMCESGERLLSRHFRDVTSLFPSRSIIWGIFDQSNIFSPGYYLFFLDLGLSIYSL
jgi:hypothetical protein